MAGPKLELFRFGMYVFFPILIMAHYGDPDWYNKVIERLDPRYITSSGDS
jgi:protein PET100